MEAIIKKLEALQCHVIDLDNQGALDSNESADLCDLAFRLSALCAGEGCGDDTADSVAAEVVTLNVTTLPAMRACQVLTSLLRAGRAFAGPERDRHMRRADQFGGKLAYLVTAHAAE